MSKNIYKYVGPEYLNKVIGTAGLVTLKCSYPMDFNDPYELFLTIDFNEQPDHLAFYADVVGDIPQLPTTCFSRSPTVVPMWAHYAQSQRGFVIEFNESQLANIFPNSRFGDVEYRDTPEEGLTEMLLRASVIGKPRYLYFLQGGVFQAAYYTKATCWSYECERRMIGHQDEIREANGLMLMDVPDNCVTALISGPRADPETILAVRDRAEKIGCKYYELKIGKSSPVPFFLDLDGKTFIYNGTNIEQAVQVCASCKEPLATESNLCPLCQIEDCHRENAAGRNVFRVLAHRGMLDEYIEGMNEISRKFRGDGGGA